MMVPSRSEAKRKELENKAKFRARHAVPGHSEAERQLAEAGRLEAMISSLKREVVNLDESLASELALSSVGTAQFKYSVSATMMQARRDNLKSTIAMLSERLARIKPSMAEPATLIPIACSSASAPNRSMALV